MKKDDKELRNHSQPLMCEPEENKRLWDTAAPEQERLSKLTFHTRFRTPENPDEAFTFISIGHPKFVHLDSTSPVCAQLFFRDLFLV